MRAVLIDVKNKTVTEVEADGSLENIYEHVKCETFECIDVGDFTIFIDEEGRMNGTKAGFSIQGWPEPVVLGNGLIVKHNEYGETVPADVSVDDVLQMVTFVDYDNVEDVPCPSPFIVSF